MVVLTEKNSRSGVTIHKITAKPAIGLTMVRNLRGSEKQHKDTSTQNSISTQIAKQGKIQRF